MPEGGETLPPTLRHLALAGLALVALLAIAPRAEAQCQPTCLLDLVGIGPGNAEGPVAAALGGNAQGEVAAASGGGNAQGGLAAVALGLPLPSASVPEPVPAGAPDGDGGNAQGGLLAVSTQGNAEGAVAISLTGHADGTVAVGGGDVLAALGDPRTAAAPAPAAVPRRP